MSLYEFKYNPLTKSRDYVLKEGSLHYKGSVDTYNDLPVAGMTEGDMYFTKDNDQLYVWKIATATGALSDYDNIGAVSEIDWSGITNKPSSSVANIDDAVGKKHDQNTDTKLLTTGATSDQSQLLHGEDLAFGEIDGNHIYAQTFQAGATGTLDKVKFYFKIDGAPSADLTVEIKAVDGGTGKPTGSALASYIIPEASLPLSEEDSKLTTVEFSSPASVVSGTKYAIVFKTDGDLYGYTGGDDSLPYANGQAWESTDGESSWASREDYEMYFETYVNSGETVDLIDNGEIKENLTIASGKRIDGRDISVDGTKLDTIEEDAVKLSTVKADSDVADAITKKHTHTNTHLNLGTGELKIKVFSQDSEPTLNANDFIAIWKDTSVSGLPAVYLIFRRGSADQLKVELT